VVIEQEQQQQQKQRSHFGPKQVVNAWLARSNLTLAYKEKRDKKKTCIKIDKPLDIIDSFMLVIDNNNHWKIQAKGEKNPWNTNK
jgi:hypothetical protein